jgi:hypothetical protein
VSIIIKQSSLDLIFSIYNSMSEPRQFVSAAIHQVKLISSPEEGMRLVYLTGLALAATPGAASTVLSLYHVDCVE